MSAKYSYAEIAIDDLIAAKGMLDLKMYNHSSRLCQQYVEKVLKEILHKKGTSETDLYLLSTHKVQRLAARASELLDKSFSKLEQGYFRSLTEYYFDANYPGDNYIKVTKEEAVETYEDTIAFGNKILSFANDKDNVKLHDSYSPKHIDILINEKKRIENEYNCMHGDMTEKETANA